MTGHQINSLVGDLVAMAQAMERLPQVEHELAESRKLHEETLNSAARIQADLEQSRSYAASLEAKVHDAEVARDDAELRFLELDERAAKAVRFLAQVQGMAVQAELELSPPKPQPEPQPEPVSVQADPIVATAHTDFDHVVSTSSAPMPVDTNTQGQSEPDPISTALTQTSSDLPMGYIATPVETTLTEPNLGPYYGLRYIDYPGWVSREEWLAGGGTNEDYDFRY